MTDAGQSPIFRVRELSKVYGEGLSAVHALRGVTLDVEQGRLLVLLEPSGSGKSTFVFQFYNLIASLTARENVSLITNRDGNRLGEIQSFMVDKYTGRVAYAIMSFGGTFGFGASLFPLPWPLLEYDVAKDGYALNITKEQMVKAPRFEASKHPEYTPEYRQTVISFYRPM